MPRAATAPRYHSIPVLGWIARDIEKSDENIWYALVIALTLIILAVSTWGVMALALTALALVPIVFVVLIAITLG